MLGFPKSPRRVNSRYRVHGVVVSMVLHGSLIIALFVVSFIPWWYDAWAAREARAIRVAYSTETEEPRDAEEKSSPVRIVSDPADVTREMIRQGIDRVAKEAEASSVEENLKRLDQLTDRLTQVSSEASIDAMASAFGALMGTGGYALPSTEEPAAGEFDHDTAQFHDIVRFPREGGGWRYVAMLLDGEGRTVEVEMSEEVAEPAYLAMERIKANPLLNRVYRKMATPVFDQLLAGMREVGKATRQLEEIAERTETAKNETDSVEEPEGKRENPFADSAAVGKVPPKGESFP